MLSGPEIAAHSSQDSCWVIINDQVYDVTEFLGSHPGGVKAILQYGGKNATKEYDLIHAPGTIEKNLPLDKHLGPVEPTTISEIDSSLQAHKAEEAQLPHISLCMSLDDLELVAKQALSPRAWAYFHSASETLSSRRINEIDWHKLTFRPRVLRNVAHINTQRTIMGQRSTQPFFIAPAAMGKLAHQDGELCLSRAASQKGIPYCVSTYASVPHEDIVACRGENGNEGCFFFQLYVPKSIVGARDLIANARKMGFKALVVTVDSPVIGKREEDERFKAQVAYDTGELGKSILVDPIEVSASIPRGVHSSTFNWADLVWIRECWDSTGPIILKGIQTAEDAKLATEFGVDGIYLSNHGGRQIDFGPSSIRTLLEIRKFCPEVLKQLDIYLDGGIRRGSDVLKALCLGARAVSLGRSFMYALGAYGTEGVSKAIEILSDEIETTMRLLGVTELSQLSPDMVNSTILENELPSMVDAFQSHLRSKL